MSDQASPADIRPDHLEVVQSILRKHLPVGFKVWVFGSRANWTTKDSSDLDLAVEGPDALDYKAMVELEVAFEESDLPYTVDVVDLNDISPSFKTIVDSQKILLSETEVHAGENNGKWQEVALGDLVDIEHGYAFKGQFIADEPDEQSDILLTPGNFAIGGGFKGDKFKYYRGDTPEGFVLCPGDLLVTMTDLSKESDTLGYPALVPSRTDKRRYLHNQRLGKIKLKGTNKVEIRYLYYVLCSRDYRNEILASSTGTTVKHTSPERIQQYRFLLPAKEEQRAIAHILGTLDDKIELNRQMAQTLEEMARAIFQDWFLDFGPVHAKLEGRDPYLPPDLWDLFPDRLVDRELGEIPEGWELKTLGEVSSLNPESWSRSNSPTHIEYVDLASTKWGLIESTQHFLWKDAPSRARRVLRPGDTIVGTVRPGNGSYSLIGSDGLTGSTGFAVIRPSHLRFRELVYFAATDLGNIERLAHQADGAAYPAIRPEIVSETGVAIPTDGTSLLDWFSATAGTILDKMESAKAESCVLAAERDTLLPSLMSGELRAVGFRNAESVS